MLTVADTPDFFKKVVLPWAQRQKIAGSSSVDKPLATYLAHVKECMDLAVHNNQRRLAGRARDLDFEARNNTARWKSKSATPTPYPLHVHSCHECHSLTSKLPYMGLAMFVIREKVFLVSMRGGTWSTTPSFPTCSCWRGAVKIIPLVHRTSTTPSPTPKVMKGLRRSRRWFRLSRRYQV